MILEKRISSYKTRMILTINNLNQQDVGSYVCVSGRKRWSEWEADAENSDLFRHFSLALLMEASSGGKEITKTSFNLGLVFLFFSSSKKVIRWVVQTEQLGFEVSEKKSFPQPFFVALRQSESAWLSINRN